MTPKDFSEIAGVLVWPITAIRCLIVFYKPLRAILEQLAASLAIKTVKLKAFGVEVEITPEQKIFSRALRASAFRRWSVTRLRALWARRAFNSVVLPAPLRPMPSTQLATTGLVSKLGPSS